MFALVTVSLQTGTTCVRAFTSAVSSVVFCTITTWFAPPLPSAPADTATLSATPRAQTNVTIRRFHIPQAQRPTHASGYPSVEARCTTCRGVGESGRLRERNRQLAGTEVASAR